MNTVGGPWCCPICGGLNLIEGEYSAAGYCQRDLCTGRRAAIRDAGGGRQTPEILAAFEKAWAEA